MIGVMLIKSSDEYYSKNEKRIIKFHHKLLLADLLYLNYAFSNNEYDGVTGEDILKYVIKGTRYTNLEKLEIMDDAMMISKIKYNKVISDKNRKEQFINLDFNN